MIWEILITFIITLFIIGVACFIRKKILNRNIISIPINDAVSVLGIPVISFYNNGYTCNFILDTGSNLSHINQKDLEKLDYDIVADKSIEVTGVEGKPVESTFCAMDIVKNNIRFTEEFSIKDLDATFDIIESESGLRIHGILGNSFFQRYKYILDFEKLVVYYNKKNGNN